MLSVELAVSVIGLYFILLTASFNDWLLNPPQSFPNVTFRKSKINDLNTYILSNGLISRTFITSPNFATIGYDSYLNGNGDTKSSIIRSLSPEAIIGIDSYNYNIGGVNFINTSSTNSASPNTAYIEPSRFLFNNLITNLSNSFIFNNNITITPISKRYNFIPGTRYSFEYINWPPLGMGIEIEFIPNSKNINLARYIRDNLRIYIRYEMYQGMPIISKSLRIESKDPLITSNIVITKIVVETLKLNVPYSPGSNADAINSCFQYSMDTIYPPIYTNMISYSGGLILTTDEAHGTDLKFYNDINMNNIFGSYQPNVDVGYYPTSDQNFWSVKFDPKLPGTINGILETFRTLEIVLDIQSDLGNFEYSSLAQRRMLSFLAPQTTENPIFAATVHSNINDEIALKNFIDQCNETGFELLIFSFGSGFNMENTSNSTLEFYKNIINYGNSRGVEIGGYDLIMEDRKLSNDEYQIIGSNGQPQNNLCFASKWDDLISGYFEDYINIGLRNIITDGPYGGQSCYSTNHTYHENCGDSVFRQEWLQNQFFKNIKDKNVYIHQPDNYFYYGASKKAMGYNEHQYSLPRWLQLSVSRMGMYDDIFLKTTTEGWMFLPITPYHSSNPDCYFEPLSQNIDQYDWALGQYFGYGVLAMMRGDQLYDTDHVKNIVIKWTSFYKKHRNILMGDIIHLRRCDMQWFDAILHVNPFNVKEKGLAMIYNPTNMTIDTNYTFSLYYTGIKNKAMVSYNDAIFVEYELHDLYHITLTLSLPPISINYYIFK